MKPGRFGMAQIVAYSPGELGDAISCDVIIQGRVRKLFRHAGRLWAMTGGEYHRGMTQAVEANEVVPDAEYTGQRTTYSDRGAELRRLEELDELDDGGRADALRDRFYDGMPARYRGQLYRLTDRRETWIAAAVALAGGDCPF